MKFNTPENANYCATIVRIKNIIPLPGCDNVVGTTIFGFQAIVGKDTKPGDMGIFFSAETQLSDEYCRLNNLYRHQDKNDDPSQKGYFEDNRRVKAIKFRGNTSNGIFMPLSSISYAYRDFENLNEGLEFDKIDDREICCKYMVRQPKGHYVPQQAKERRVELKYFPEHFSTDNYFKNDRNIPEGQEIIITQKVHGTSIRIANTIVKRKLTTRDKIAQFFGVKVQTTEYATVFGSRKVVKDANNPDQAHYYETDIWTTEGKKLEGLVPENFMVFAELIGWTEDGAPIQVGYTYCLPKGTCRLYVYRVAFINDRGLVVDLSWDQVKQFCAERNLNVVPELDRMRHKDFDARFYLDKALKDNVHIDALAIEQGTVDEGICIRVDGIAPKIYKAKSPLFLEHETRLLDKGTTDLESAGI